MTREGEDLRVQDVERSKGGNSCTCCPFSSARLDNKDDYLSPKLSHMSSDQSPQKHIFL
jgi:hypothetical protein